MPKTKEPLTIPEIVDQFKQHELTDQIEGLRQLQEIVSEGIVKSRQNVAAYEKISNNGKSS
jgi:hypothetical protein